MDIYREEILEHWRSPNNFGSLSDASVIVDQINPLCGDQVRFFFKIKGNKIEDVSFVGNGCAISIASASILSTFIKGKSIKYLSKITGEDVLDLIGGPSTGSGFPPARLKCAFLPLEAMRKITTDTNQLEARV